MNNLKDQMVDFIFAKGSTIRLDTFRMLIGITMALYMGERFLYAPEWLTSAGFHVSQANLSYHPLTVPLLPISILPWFTAALFLCIFAVIIGWQLRFTIPLTLAFNLYVTFADQYSAFTVNKLFIVTLIVLMLARKGGHWCIGNVKKENLSQWPMRILQMSFLIHYFTAGWSKIVHGDWLTNQYALYTQLQGMYRTEFAAWLFQIGTPKMWVLMQYSGLGFELLVPVIFTVKATRRVAFTWGLFFQLILALCMHQLIYFMLVMSCFYVLFMDDRTLLNFKMKFKRGN